MKYIATLTLFFTMLSGCETAEYELVNDRRDNRNSLNQKTTPSIQGQPLFEIEGPDSGIPEQEIVFRAKNCGHNGSGTITWSIENHPQFGKPTGSDLRIIFSQGIFTVMAFCEAQGQPTQPATIVIKIESPDNPGGPTVPTGGNGNGQQNQSS